MKRKIKELMAQITELAVVNVDSTVFEAILEIGIAKSLYNGGLKWPAALVTDDRGRIVGFLDFHNMLKGLEPEYADLADAAQANGVSGLHIRSEIKKRGILRDGLDELCRRAGETTIRAAMSGADEGGTIDSEAPISEAVLQMMVTGRDYLFVREGETLAGIVGLNDIMMHFCERVRACRV